MDRLADSGQNADMGWRHKARDARDLLKFLYIQRTGGLSAPDNPHMDEASTVEFTRRLGEARSYAEFGSGGSTVLASRIGLPTVSVESDRFYAGAVRKKLAPGHKVDLRPVDIGLTREWGNPVFRGAGRIAIWKRYLTVMTEAIEGRGFPDFWLVDGRFRVACVYHIARLSALRGGAPTTIFVDDYEDRPHYHQIETVLGPPIRYGRAALFTLAQPSPLPEELVDASLSDYR